jgi:hypothetical protein
LLSIFYFQPIVFGVIGLGAAFAKDEKSQMNMVK